MRKLVVAINWLSITINHFVNVITAALIGLLTLIVLNGVFYRYILDNPLPWVLPISKILLVWIGLLGISIAFAEAEHVSMKALVYNLPEPFQVLLSVISCSLIFIFLLVVAIKGFHIALTSNELGVALLQNH